MRKSVVRYAKQLFLTLPFALCYLGGNYIEYSRSIDAELNGLQRTLKHDEKLWLYAQAELNDGVSFIDILAKIRNKVFWYVGDNYSVVADIKLIPYMVDSLGRDIEGKEVLLPGHLREDKPSIVSTTHLIQIIFPLENNTEKKFLVFSHFTKNHCQINKPDTQRGFNIDKYSLALKYPIKAFMYNNAMNLAILCLLCFVFVSLVFRRLQTDSLRKLHNVYKKRAQKSKLLEKELKSTKLIMHGLREGNQTKFATLMAYSANYLLMHEKARALFEEFGKHQNFVESKYPKSLLLVDVFRGKNQDITEIITESLKPLKTDFAAEGINFSVETAQNGGVFYSDQVFLSSFLLILFANIKNFSKPQKIDVSISAEIENGNLLINLAGNFVLNSVPSLANCNVTADTKKFGSTCYLEMVVKPLVKAMSIKEKKADKVEESGNVVKLFKK